MEETSAENAKVSDSGYSNTCSNSQSQRSSGSSISRNSICSESSGYCGRRPSTFASSNEALPQPISKRKDKEYKKKKSKTSLVVNAEAEITLRSTGKSPDNASYNFVTSTKPILEKQTEIATVELVDATDPGEHNGDTLTGSPETGLASRSNLLDDSSSQANDGFCAVISMHDGLVLYITPSICTALGYSKDAWIGRSFINYVHSNDKTTLADQIKNGLVSSQEDRPKGINERRASLFCGLRKNVKTENSTLNKDQENARSNLYLPFHLTLTFRDFRQRVVGQQQPRAMFLVVTAQPVHSAYKAPEETIISSIFTTRHTATCLLSHVDPDVVQYLGYLPQDMIGCSLFDFYHPEDLPFIKDIYETVIKLEGSSFRSKPYRFAAQNGSYVVLETEWSSFINPWTKKLEFVVGQHRVLRGPMDPDIFRVPPKNEFAFLANISEEVLKESKIIQNEIRTLLDESIQRTSEITEHDVSKRCKDLASFMESLLQEIRTPALGKDTLATDDRSFSGSRNPLLQEHDSVMLGEISPHHEYYDSKSSTETPPSYNQLNYNENIERFFKSKPSVATMYGSDEEILNLSNDEGGKTSPNSAARKCMSPINGSGASGSGSAENLSSSSNNLPISARRDNTSNTTNSNTTTTTESFKQPILTESLLSRHNEDMEKMMMQKHRELRSSIKNNDKLKDLRIKTSIEKISVDQNNHYIGQCHGIKRSGSHSWEGDSFKVSKQDEVSRTSTVGPLPINVATTIASMSVDQTSTVFQTNGNINLWPSLSVTVPSATPVLPCINQNVNCQAIPRIPMIPQMIPAYYLPVPQQIDVPIPTAKYSQPPTNVIPSSVPMSQQSPYISYVATAMPGVMYPPIIGTSTPGTMMYQPFLIPEQASMPQENAKSMDRKRSASQATSIKAEPGSIMAMSESSKKVLSPGELFSSCISNDGGCSSVVDIPTPINNKQHMNIDYNSNESSSSSFYSSLLYKSSESNCNPDQKTTEQVAENSQEAAKVKHAIHRRDPPWLEGVQLTPELIYEYQLRPKTLNEVLESDMDSLKKISQPLLVNEQLGQLYFDLELEGFGTKLMLEDGITSSESDSGSSNSSWIGLTSQHKQKRRMVKYGRLIMIHEENAPLPPPLPSQTVSCQQT
ncbi:PREDICTED: period circadian protein isoform X2 [Polistes canadensis]|uniref:period circadian protein isoform X2 n=1 Tax=Polistes canadensis TaxID=91411 RepID=UPI000718B80B|nr:PREDICTED: period circadian protein isoform X2 [Polistes canadensis]